MAQYGHLSDEDPEWVAIASSVPPFIVEDIVEFRKKFLAIWDEANSRLEAETNGLECGSLINRSNLSSYR